MTASRIWFSFGLLLACLFACNGTDSTAPTRVFVKPDPVKAGHRWTVPYEGREDFRLLTRSVEPFIVEIENFATKEECEAIMKTAEDQGLQKSEVSGGELYKVSDDYILDKPEDVLYALDLNGDSEIALEEARVRLRQISGGFFSVEQTRTLLQEAGVKLTDDGLVASVRNFAKHQKKLFKSMATYIEEHPEIHSRYSKQVWLGDAPAEEGERPLGQDIFEEILKKAGAITGLSANILVDSEALQVVRYGRKGHYHCHMDTGFEVERNPRCCVTRNIVEGCAECRFATILFYLNDATDLVGGGTAFPAVYLSANETEDFEEDDRCQLNSNCSNGIVVQPAQGKAVLWYNHNINESGHIGSVDFRTHHGGCEVQSGTKWIANLWMTFQNEDYFSLANNSQTSQESESAGGVEHEGTDHVADSSDNAAASRPADEL